MNKLRVFFAGIWQPLLTAICGAGVAIFVLGYKLGSMTPGYSAAELASLQGVGSLRAIAENPLFLPFKLGEYIVIKLGVDLPVVVRGVSALIGFFCVWGFYLLLKRWHTRRIAILGTLMFLCSTWFLATARSATPSVLYIFNILSIIFIGALVHQKKASKTSLLLAAICAALLVYSPGMIWLLAIGVLWQFKGIVSLLKQNPVWLWLGASIIFGLLLVPAIYATYHNPRFILDVLAIPKVIVPIEMAKRVVLVPAQLFVRGPEGSYWLARLPFMDLFSGAMFAVGFYNYYLRFKLSRTQFLIWLSVVLIVLIAVLSVPTVTMLPIVYVIIAAGITLLLQQWFTVFPLNPLARNLGFAVMVLAVLASSWFQASRYFIAWRYNSVTQSTYTHTLRQ